MPDPHSALHPPVCIIGAGPAGTAAALKLSRLGIPCTLIDKATFPRDKVCGDAISGKVTLMLRRLDPALLDRFAVSPIHTGTWGLRIGVGGRQLEFPFLQAGENSLAPGYVSKRQDFDNFLVEEARRSPGVCFLENTEAVGFEKMEGGWSIVTRSSSFGEEAAPKLELRATILLVANGAQSQFSRKIAGLEIEKAHHAGAVRAYFRGVRDLHPDQFIELHFLEEISPGYFWIFPLPGGEANVGLGMRSDHIARRKINLRKTFAGVLKNHPALAARFRGAEQIGEPEGFGLPLGSKRRRISGDHFLLLGDAAHLIDPLTGEGIGNAFYSGIYAAEQAQACIAAGDFSAKKMAAYDARIARVPGREMRLSYTLQKMLAWPGLVKWSAGFVEKRPRLLAEIARMVADVEYRKKAVNPLYWLKAWLHFGDVPKS